MLRSFGFFPYLRRLFPTAIGCGGGGGGGGVGDLYMELWKACAGPLVDVPRGGDRVYYFPQGHMEQVSDFGSRMLDRFGDFACLPFPNRCSSSFPCVGGAASFWVVGIECVPFLLPFSVDL